MEKPPSVKSTRRARAVFPEGKFSDAYSQNTLLAHLSELVGKKTMLHSPEKTTHSLLFLARRPHPHPQYLPSSQGECGQREAWVPQAGCSMEHSFAPEQTKPLKFIAFPRIKSNLSLLSPVPAHKELGVFPFSHSKLYTIAFLHIKQTS